MVTISEPTLIDDTLLKELTSLFRQLNPEMQSPSIQNITATISDPNCRLLVARVDGAVVGTLTLTTYPTLSARRGWIEDVVVDSSQRRRGIGRSLIQRAKELASEMGCQTLSLTSSPHRQAAHALYLAEEFLPVGTTLFRLKNQ